MKLAPTNDETFKLICYVHECCGRGRGLHLANDSWFILKGICLYSALCGWFVQFECCVSLSNLHLNADWTNYIIINQGTTNVVRYAMGIEMRSRKFTETVWGSWGVRLLSVSSHNAGWVRKLRLAFLVNCRCACGFARIVMIIIYIYIWLCLLSFDKRKVHVVKIIRYRIEYIWKSYWIVPFNRFSNSWKLRGLWLQRNCIEMGFWK